MSFSLVTKNELARVQDPLRCCQESELAALIKMDGLLQLSGRRVSLSIVNHNAAVARKLFKMCKELFGLRAQVLVRKKLRLRKNNVYVVRIQPQAGLLEMLISLGILREDNSLREGIPWSMQVEPCCHRAYLRGLFLGGGSVNSPGSDYHMEFITGKEPLAHDIVTLLRYFELTPGISTRKNWFVVYLKESEQIVSCLNIMGAHQALLEFENTRIIKDMRNHVNRLVNCETANLNKTVDASLRQVQNIRLINERMGLSQLPRPLQEIAGLRLQYPDASLKELGEMLRPPLGKSGVNHRLRKLAKIAEKLR